MTPETEVWFEIEYSLAGKDDWFSTGTMKTLGTETSARARVKEMREGNVYDRFDLRIVRKTLVSEPLPEPPNQETCNHYWVGYVGAGSGTYPNRCSVCGLLATHEFVAAHPHVWRIEYTKGKIERKPEDMSADEILDRMKEIKL